MLKLENGLVRAPAKPRFSATTSMKKKLAELLTSYRRVGELLEALIGRERLYQPDFMKGLDEALQEVSLKKTHEVRSFADFIS